MPADEDVVYATAGESRLLLDIIRPVAPPTRTAVIFLHGATWGPASKRDMRPSAQALAARGFVGLTVDYRPPSEAPWPASIQDVKAAVSWARANADGLGVEPDRIVLYGISKGAHLALLAAGTPRHPAFDPRGGASSEVAAVIAIHAPTTLFTAGERPPHASEASAILGRAATLTRARAASPTTYISASFPPSLLLHGTADRLVHHAASQWMYDALCAAGAPADLHLFHGQDHGFSRLPSMARLIEAEVALFLDRAVVDPAKYLEEIERFGMFPPQTATGG